MSDLLPAATPLSAAELDRRLEKAVRDHERSEKLICFYLNQINRRKLYHQLGFENLYDYALERFGFCRSKTRALLYLGKRLSQLPALTEALAQGRIGWTKAAKVASVATPETDAEWTEKAVASSYRELEREISDGMAAHGGKISIWLTAEQASIWQQALEICRRLSGEEIDPGLALEYIAGEFLATYLAPVEQAVASGELACAEKEREESEAAATPVAPSEPAAESELAVPSEERASDSGAGPISLEVDRRLEASLCPDNADLPSPVTKCYAPIHQAVLERDSWLCQYPGCSVRYGLHVHHIEYRSRFGRKKWQEMNDPSNLITACWFHHRMLHAHLIALKRSADGQLEWRRPAVMETAAQRHEPLASVDDELLAEPDRVVGEIETPSAWAAF